MALVFLPAVLINQIAVAASISSDTLEAKAFHFERIIRERHVKDGFIRELTLNIPGQIDTGGTLLHSDNDGLWTSLYVVAMSFKYGATHDPHAKDWARESLQALFRLESMTGISGFPARSIVEAGEPERFQYDGEWHPDASGQWEWKGNTSSDEIDGHFFAYSVYYDLVADEMEKAEIRKVVSRMMDHIIKNDWYLIDVDGKPTRWGVWNPRQLNENRFIHGLPDEDWGEERGLNSLEILSHLKTANYITGNESYRKKYLELIQRHGYARNVERQVIDPMNVHYSDAELAFCAYYPLLKYEENSKLLTIYRTSLSKTWKILRADKNPWANFTACLFLTKNCNVDAALQTLRDIPAEQINWKKAPASKISIQRWNADPKQDAGENGSIEGDGVIFLLPYWMGRFHGFIREKF